MPNSNLVYSVSQAGKTTWCLKLARYLYAKTGKRTRWYLGDGGGETITVGGGLDFIDVMPYPNRKFPIETTQRISEGWWAEEPENPDSKLYLPTADEFARIAMMVWEGTTYMADYIMGMTEGGLAYRMSKGEMLNNDASFRFKDGDTQFGGNARTHYGFVQRHVMENIKRTHAVPVPMKWWTGHERRVDEDGGVKDPFFGPEIAGRAMTARVGASFSHTIHLDIAEVLKKKQDPLTKKEVEYYQKEYRAYTRTHFDPNGTTATRYFAGVRLPDLVIEAEPNFMPEYIPADPVQFYALLDKAQELNKQLEAEKGKKAPTLSITQLL